MCVPNTGTEAWTNSLNLPLVDDWRPWYVNQQVAGYVKEYDSLTYATIKGSGHTVPEYKVIIFRFYFNFSACSIFIFLHTIFGRPTFLKL